MILRDRAAIPAFLGRPVVHVCLIAVACLLVYSNTLSVPFQLDESFYLSENPLIKDHGGPRGTVPDDVVRQVTGAEMRLTLRQRYLGYLTFAWNYRVHGFDVEGYHFVNIAIHVLTSLLVYLLVRTLLRTPVLASSLLQQPGGMLALFSALLFAVHPLQTEAVTYIMQRLASLAAFFYLLSVTAYVRSRIATTSRGRIAHYLLSLAAGLCAMKTKENAFTLPLIICACEAVFFRGSMKSRLPLLAPVLLLLPVIPLTLLTAGGQPAAQSGGIDRLDYLLTQLTVLVSYVRLLLVPAGQSFIHAHQVYRSLTSPAVAFSALFLLLLMIVCAWLLHRSRKADPGSALPAFGLIWFLVTLSVESTLFPLPMVMCEYRLYLPSAGFIMALLAGSFLWFPRCPRAVFPAAGFVFLVTVVLLFGALAYARNNVWGSSITLWEDTVRKNPTFPAAHDNLAAFYLQGGRPQEALEEYTRALALGFEHPRIHQGLGRAYGALGENEKAIAEFRIAVRAYPRFAEAYFELGNVLARMNRLEEAAREYRTALKLQPDHIEARNNLAGVYMLQGTYESAAKELTAVLAMAPDLQEAAENLRLVTGLLPRKAVAPGPMRARDIR